MKRDWTTELMFLALAIEEQNFKKAAKALNLDPSQGSRLVKRLETELGFTLFQRSTRYTRATPEALLALPKIKGILSLWRETAELKPDFSGPEQGHLSIECGYELGKTFLVPYIKSFKKKYPGIELHVLLNDDITNPYDAYAQLFIRLSRPVDSTLLRVKLRDEQMRIVGAPELVRRHGPIRTLDDLKRFPKLGFERKRAAEAWRYKAKGEWRGYEFKPTLSINSGQELVELAKEGLGLTWLPDFLIEDALKQKSLIEVLPDIHWEKREICAVFAPGLRNKRELKLFLQELKAGAP